MRLIREDGARGVTSTPTIFRRAIAESTAYDYAIHLLVEHGREPRDMFCRLALGDIRVAPDLLRPVCVRSEGIDGFVSFELEPRLAHDTTSSVAMAHP